MEAKSKYDVRLSFHPELTLWDMLFSQALEFEKRGNRLQLQTCHRLQEIIAILTKGMLSDQLTLVGFARKHFKIDEL